MSFSLATMKGNSVNETQRSILKTGMTAAVVAMSLLAPKGVRNTGRGAWDEHKTDSRP